MILLSVHVAWLIFVHILTNTLNAPSMEPLDVGKMEIKELLITMHETDRIQERTLKTINETVTADHVTLIPLNDTIATDHAILNIVNETVARLEAKQITVNENVNKLECMVNWVNETVTRQESTLNTVKETLLNDHDTLSKVMEITDRQDKLLNTVKETIMTDKDILVTLTETVASKDSVNTLTEKIATQQDAIDKLTDTVATLLKNDQERTNKEREAAANQAQAINISYDYMLRCISVGLVAIITTFYVGWKCGKGSTNTQTAKKPQRNDLDVTPSVNCRSVYLPTSNKKNSTDMALFRSFISFIRDIHNVNVEVLQLTDASQQPAILPCIGTSRLSTDVNDAFNNSQLPAGCVPLLLLIHPRAPHNSYVFPTRDKGTEEVLQRVQDVIDVVASDQQIYDCDTNRKAAREFLAILNQR